MNEKEAKLENLFLKSKLESFEEKIRTLSAITCMLASASMNNNEQKIIKEHFSNDGLSPGEIGESFSNNFVTIPTENEK